MLSNVDQNRQCEINKNTLSAEYLGAWEILTLDLMICGLRSDKLLSDQRSSRSE